MSYLVLPQAQGARIIYQTHVAPFFEQHERQIEEMIGRIHERAKTYGLQYFYQAVDWVREKVLGLEPRRRTTAAPPPAAGPTAYAQALFSRFNLPTAAASALPSSAADWYSTLTSAVTAIASTGQSRETQAEKLAASGILRSDQVASMSQSEKARFYATQRERLEVLVSALAREERQLSRDRDDTEDLAYGASYEGLRKNGSEHSFDHIEPEDLGDSTAPLSSNEGWASGWFGGRDSAQRRTASGSNGR